MNKTKLFNVEGDDSIKSQEVFGGNPTGILNLNNIKYTWVKGLYKVMLGNFWIPEKVSLIDDKSSIENLTDERMRLYNKL